MQIVAIVPARMASSRFPGKPLKEICGLPMVEHVRRRAVLAGGFSEVLVATCDEEIARSVRRYGGKVVMTSPDHEAATDRVREAARSLPCTHVVNVQGDEILVLPKDLQTLADVIRRHPEVPVWNAVGAIEDAGTLKDRSVVKCLLSVTGRILLCARDCSSLAHPESGTLDPVRSLLGILAYRLDYLNRYAELSRTPMEKAESIDQLRIIEHDGILQSVPFTAGYPGINHPAEVAQTERILASDPLQQKVLKQVLSFE